MPLAHEPLKTLLAQVLELDAPAREAVLADHPDAELAAAARALLGLDKSAAALDRGAQAWLPDADEPPVRPAQIGPYRILGLLGQGGMGAVYHGVRNDGSFALDVAIKVMRHAHSAEQRQRLQRERELLARLQHPAIARVLDGGTTPDGQPWMAIERVHGEALDRFVRTHALPLRRRIALLVEVMEAVQCAHQNLIVHRDLKPSNVLVQSDGQPKLIDFGIAKDLGPTTRTATAEHAPMTFAYAAPEQIRGAPVTTATDVYALGVMLYELLTGARPHLPRAGDAGGLSLLQAITDTDATAPSILLSRRSGTARAAVREVSGDLDTIVLKALSRDPARRYHSARAFADDLQRWLAHRPILARPERMGYRLRKWVRRNRRLAVALGALLLTTLAGAAVAWHLSAQNQLRTAEALRAARAAESLQRVLTGMFEEADLFRQERTELSVRTLLELAQARAERELRSEPDLYLNVASELANGEFRVVDRALGARRHQTLFAQLQSGVAVAPATRVRVLMNHYDAVATLGDMHAVAAVGPLLERALQDIPATTELWASARLSLLSQGTDNRVQADGLRALLQHRALRANDGLKRWTLLLLANEMRLLGEADAARRLLEAELDELRTDGTPLERAYFLDRLARMQTGAARIATMLEVWTQMRDQLGASHPVTQQKRYSWLLARLPTDPDPALDAEIEDILAQQRANGGIQYFSMVSNWLSELNSRRQFARARVWSATALAVRDVVGISRDHAFHGSAQAEGFAARAQANEPGLEAELDRFVATEPQSYYRALALYAKAMLQLGRRDCTGVSTTLAVFEATGDPASRLQEAQFLRGECALHAGAHADARSAFEALVAADAEEPRGGRMIAARAQVQLARLIAADQPQRAADLDAQGQSRLARYLPIDDPWWAELGLTAPR